MKRVDLNKFSKELGGFADLSLAKKKRAVIAGVARSIPDLIQASPVDTGMYANSWDFTVQEDSVTVGNYAPYAGIIEYGARKHWAPIAPLLAWAKRVLGSGSQPPEYDAQVRALAYAVQKKIAMKGQDPRHIMENEIPKIIQNIREELKRVR